MSQPAPQCRFDASAYLDWEAQQADKHEYLDGDVFVTCAEADRAQPLHKSTPALVAEVLSPFAPAAGAVV